jgi:hypothetical protein
MKPNSLASEMFFTFARFEYALKAVGFHKGDEAAEPDWRAFAESVSGKPSGSAMASGGFGDCDADHHNRHFGADGVISGTKRTIFGVPVEEPMSEGLSRFLLARRHSRCARPEGSPPLNARRLRSERFWPARGTHAKRLRAGERGTACEARSSRRFGARSEAHLLVAP